MICKKCHVHVEDGETFCPVCGAQLGQEEVPDQVLPVEETAEAKEAIEFTIEVREEDVPAEEKITEEEADGKKHKSWIKVTAIICCVALFLGLAASVWYGINGGFAPRANDVYYKDQYYAEEDKAVKAADKVVATVGGRELTNAQLQVFYWMGVYEFVQQYSSYLSYFGLDPSQPLSEQYVEEGGETWEQFFLEGALNTWHNYQSLLIYAEGEGYQLSEELAQQLDAVMESMEASLEYYGFTDLDEMIQADMGASADEAAYRYYMENHYGGMEYFEGLYDQHLPSREEIEAYYERNAADIESNYGVNKESGRLIDVRHILVCPTGGTTDENGDTTYSEAEWEICRLKAEGYLQQWKDGEATEASFAELAMQVTEDPGSSSTGGLYSYVYEGQMVPAFNDWCFDESRQSGDTGLVQTNYGYHIMYFVYGDEGWLRYAESDMVTSACTDVMEQAMEEYPMEVNYKNIVISKADMAS